MCQSGVVCVDQVVFSCRVRSPQSVNSVDAVINARESLPQKWFFVFTGMQLNLHATRSTPHDASRLVQAMLAWPVKTRGAPSRHF